MSYADPHPFEINWTRAVQDAAGVRWRLREFTASGELGPPLPPALLADNGVTLRRIAAYPRDWAERPDADLLALVHSPAAPVGVVAGPYTPMSVPAIARDADESAVGR